MSFEKKIVCIGAGYVGGPTMAMIAKKCPNYKVTVVDINEERINAWNSDELPIYEPGLAEVVQAVRGKNLFFETDVNKSIEEGDIIFVSVNTPTKTFGEGAGKAADLQFVEKTARQILKNSTSDKIVVEKSTLPVRTAEAIKKILHSGGESGPRFQVISNPEFLAEGTAINDLERPDRVLIGSEETEAGLLAREEIKKIYLHWVDAEKIITSNLWSSELTKLVANAFLAQRISSINSISALCEVTGANIHEVSHAVGKDSRIGEKFLKPSVGFGGSCFQKDILNLVYIAESYNLSEVAAYWENVVNINFYQEARFVRRIMKTLFTVAGKKIVLFGFAFKTDTGDTRESPAISVAKHLLGEHAHVVITDPQALENAKKDLQGVEGEVTYEADPVKAVEGADAIAIITGWKEYQDLDYSAIFSKMEQPAFLFDGCNLLDADSMFKIGFNVVPIGCPEKLHISNQ